jgi:hypothetical protein
VFIGRECAPRIAHSEGGYAAHIFTTSLSINYQIGALWLPQILFGNRFDDAATFSFGGGSVGCPSAGSRLFRIPQSLVTKLLRSSDIHFSMLMGRYGCGRHLG